MNKTIKAEVDHQTIVRPFLKALNGIYVLKLICANWYSFKVIYAAFNCISQRCTCIDYNEHRFKKRKESKK